MQKPLRPVVAKIAAKEPRRRISFCTVLVVVFLRLANTFHRHWIGQGFSAIQELQVKIKLVIEGLKDTRLDRLRVGLGEEQVFREVLISII